MQNKFLKRFLGITIIALIMLSSLPISVLAETYNAKPKLSFKAHVQSFGWLESSKTQIGTMGKSKRMEALDINIVAPAGVKLKYRAHVQNYGWMNWVTADNKELVNSVGTTGKSKRVEAIQLVLEGSKDYTIKYRAHVQTYGWLDWVIAEDSINDATTKKGTYAGTSGESKRIEALEVVVIPKTEAEKVEEKQKVTEQAESMEELKAKQEEAKKKLEEEAKKEAEEAKKQEEQKQEETKGQETQNQSNPQVQKPQIPESEQVNQHVHDFTDWEVVTEPACNHSGQKIRRCTSCGKVESKIINSTYDHKLVRTPALDKPATCTERGANYSKCLVCGDVFFSVTQPLGGHLWANSYSIDKQATCTENGIKSIHCTREGCLVSKEQTTIQATGHNIVTTKAQATCTQGSSITKKCTKCNYSVTEITGSAKNHTYSNYVSDNNATCTKDGTKTATCTTCGHKDTITDVGTKLNHKFEILNDKVLATCELSGREASKRCTECGTIVKGSVIPALGHNYTHTSEISTCEGDCTEEICTRCGFTNTDSIDSIRFGNGHKWVEQNGIYSCTECKESVPDANGKYSDIWWWAWNYSRKNAIWFTGFTCNMNYCYGYNGSSKILESRRGEKDTISMTAPTARDGYKFEGWYEISTGKKVTATKTSGEGTTYANGNKITVGWKDMYKGFEAKYVPSK